LPRCAGGPKGWLGAVASPGVKKKNRGPTERLGRETVAVPGGLAGVTRGW